MCNIDFESFNYMLLFEDFIKCSSECYLLDVLSNKGCSNCSLCSDFCTVLEHRATVGSALCALKKQIPVKVEYESSGYADGHPVYDYAFCPICGYDFEEYTKDWQSNFCPECGQRLDWTMDN